MTNLVEDTYAEAFRSIYTEFLITARDRRWLDIALVLWATDALVRLFSNRSPLLLPLRRVALSSLGRFQWLRQLSLRAM
ncbi:MAG: hypothetical protein ACKPHU_23110, partial [Planctomycetaceae bacterium]